jgi:CRP-like cAMP-binding protein
MPPGNGVTGASEESESGTFLSALRAEERADLEARGRRRQFPKGSSLIVEGESADRVFLVLRGRVKISILTEEGREVLLGLREPGDLLGELSFLDRQPRSSTCMALDPVEALAIPAADFQKFLGNHPRVTMVLLEMISRRLRDADSKRMEFSAYDSVGRVARRLLELAERFGEKDEGEVRISLALSQEELAGWTGSSREAVSKALGTLRSLGWIETHRRGVTILDLQALRRRAG